MSETLSFFIWIELNNSVWMLPCHFISNIELLYITIAPLVSCKHYEFFMIGSFLIQFKYFRQQGGGRVVELLDILTPRVSSVSLSWFTCQASCQLHHDMCCLEQSSHELSIKVKVITSPIHCVTWPILSTVKFTMASA